MTRFLVGLAECFLAAGCASINSALLPTAAKPGSESGAFAARPLLGG